MYLHYTNSLRRRIVALVNFGSTFDLPALNSNLSILQKQSSAEDFWNDSATAQKVLKKISIIEKEINLWESAQSNRDDAETHLELLDEEDAIDSAHLKEAEDELARFTKTIDDLELRLMLSGEDDDKDAILQIHPGAGGTESQDWTDMLYRMYIRWVEQQQFSYDVIDFQPGEEAGIKDVTIEVKGESAYGLLKAEMGVHRLVRISPFDASNRRHTSFASVFVYPSVDDDIEIEVSSDDLKIDTYRASGAGGQHVNKTESAVRITHIPTGTVAQCQNERSQHKNKANALKILKARLYKLKQEEQAEARKDLEDQKMDIGWGSQIRSYVFHPYTMVKDHRTKVEIGDAKRVMDGDLNGFMRAYLLQKAGKSIVSEEG
ncbi:MAG TPA: peptide chain release factor 2 [Candidatus Marinimicrobia bacterium]|nr:peptide chain release factor 2 [Candidatus Neomarinimicrobiota bacterium]HIB57839.1 peptide chain release factor 2 [Candidatus Neomarinimicrobiota bacterium]HIN46107.1 peptide chain release factor 2 [Candidatus Neomarinimicrobiota bacterium]